MLETLGGVTVTRVFTYIYVYMCIYTICIQGGLKENKSIIYRLYDPIYLQLYAMIICIIVL
jgi:hypothetical protein